MGTRIRNNADTESSIRENERQRISRDLHNTTSQLLTVLQLHIGQLRRQQLASAEPIISEMAGVIHEIRLSIKQIEAQQSDGHDCGELRESVAKAFFALNRDS